MKKILYTIAGVIIGILIAVAIQEFFIENAEKLTILIIILPIMLGIVGYKLSKRIGLNTG